jgi:hypothetical protein
MIEHSSIVRRQMFKEKERGRKREILKGIDLATAKVVRA